MILNGKESFRFESLMQSKAGILLLAARFPAKAFNILLDF